MCVCVQVCMCMCACGEVSLGSTMEEQSVNGSRSGWVDKLSTKGSSTRTRTAKVHGISLGEQWLGLSHRTAEKHPDSSCQGVLSPQTAFINEFLRSLRYQEHKKEEKRENKDETLKLGVCGSDAMLTAISRATSDAGPFPVSTPRAGAGTTVGESTGRCPVKGPGSLFHVKKRKYLSPGHPVKLTLLWLSLCWQLLRW